MISVVCRWALLSLLTTSLVGCGGGGGGGGGGGSTPPAANEPPSFSGDTAFVFAEDESVDFLLTITDPDSTTVTITGINGGDSALFILDLNSGRLTANTPTGRFDFEQPQDADGDNVYEQQLELSDGVNTVRDTIVVTITDVDEGPQFTTLPEVALDEGVVGDLVTFSAIDPEGGTVSDFAIIEVSKLGEPVNSQRLLDAFSIDSVTGTLRVDVPFDAEVDGTQDVISVSVQASDGAILGAGSVAIRLVDLPSQLIDGYRLSGRSSLAPLGTTASVVGDVDVNGSDEIWVAEDTDETGLETAYLLWSASVRDAQNGGAADQALADLSASERVVVTGDDRSLTDRRSTLAASAAGDVDADGLADVLVTPKETRDQSQVGDGIDGDNAVLLWGDALAVDSVDLRALSAGAAVRLTGLPRSANIGITARAADFDGDGLSDLVLGMPGLNRTLLIFGQALAAAGDELNLANADSSAVVLLQSELTPQAIIQQSGQVVQVIPDLNGDDVPELAISGAGLEPDFANAVFVVDGAALAAAKGGSGVFNLSADANDASVVELRISNLSIASLAALGDVDSDGLNDLAIGHVGNFGEARIASLVFGSALGAALGATEELDLDLPDGNRGVNIFADNQIDSQTVGTSVTVVLVPTVGGGVGSELVVAIDESSSLGRSLNGQIVLLEDTALLAASGGELRFDDEAFPLAVGRRLLGYASFARTGRALSISDTDGDGTLDLITASTSAGSDQAEVDAGGLVILPGTLLLEAFAADTASNDLAQTFVREG